MIYRTPTYEVRAADTSPPEGMVSGSTVNTKHGAVVSGPHRSWKAAASIRDRLAKRGGVIVWVNSR